VSTENTERPRYPAHRPDRPADLHASELAALAQWFDGDGLMRFGSTEETARHDNTRRAGFAATAVVQFAIGTGQWSPAGREDDEVTSCLVFLLSNLRHLCDALGLDYRELARIARARYDRELRGEFA
jgi:hypothetical protein